ncbi:MAG: PhoU domain-containing protein [Acidimicrobiia bacterium]|nr:PhoU domain-containing protein [Acidimicrobiia bacterium]
MLEFFRGGSEGTLQQVAVDVQEMLSECRHTFDLANAALFGGSAAAVHDEVKETDRGVNKRERAVRKALVVHVSVHGTRTDLPMVLGTMSIVKDAERIGDYAKNIWDLADAGVDFSEAPDLDRLAHYRDRTSRLVSSSARVFSDRDAEAAHGLIGEADEWQSEYDDFVGEQLTSEGPARDAVSRALYARYLKRITAHAINVLTLLVMPVHRLDYYDEDRADR